MIKKLFAFGTGLLLTSSAWALPTLQLDIVGGVYDPVTETVVATGNPFTLVALYDTTKPHPTTSFFISAAILPKTSDLTSFGSFTINGVQYGDGGSGTVQYGTPPVDEAFPDLPAHSVYPTIYAEVPFSFIDDAAHRATAYNVQDNPGGLVQNDLGTLLFIEFTINISGLAAGDVVHFDLYDEVIKTQPKYATKTNFAPFSHDAQSGTNDFHRDVPDTGTTLALLGMACAVLMTFPRRRAC